MFLSGFSQGQVANQYLSWYGYVLTVPVGDKWFVQTELQERHYLAPLARHQKLVRTHLHRKIGASGWDVSVGGAFFLTDPTFPDAMNRFYIPELRPHIEGAYKHRKLKKFSLDHRLRAEARYFQRLNVTGTDLGDGFAFGNYRFRYRLQAQLPIWQYKEGKFLSFKSYDEYHIQTGGTINGWRFDQNRLFLGFSIELSASVSIDAGYLNWYQLRSNGGYFNRHIASFTLAHKLRQQK